MNNDKELKKQLLEEKKSLKRELISNGSFDYFRQQLKTMYKDNLEEIEMNINKEYWPLLDELLKSTKRKKSNFRRHANYMYRNYDNLGFLTLTFNEEKIGLDFDYMKELATSILSECFEDYIGKFELSPKGRIHAHFIVCWNGVVEYDLVHNFRAKRVTNKGDLINKWYGSKDKQKYGIVELILIDKSENINANKPTNYLMKNLNTMESYITKEEQFENDVKIDPILLMKINYSYVITKRNSAYQKWKKDFEIFIKTIKQKCRAFDSEYYDKYKWLGNDYFITWYINHKNDVLTDYLNMFDCDFKEIVESDYTSNSQCDRGGGVGILANPRLLHNDINIKNDYVVEKKKESSECLLLNVLNEAVINKPLNRLINDSKPPYNYAIDISG